ncbi:MAG: ATP-binding protein [bacterium]
MKHLPQLLPFPALVGQERLKRALLMLAVNPRLGGLLVRGAKGTAKSTAARGLAALLPPLSVHDGCPFGCPAGRPDVWCDECRQRKDHSSIEVTPPFRTLPLGVTEDQVLGTFDLEHALQHGERRYEPGLLARVNQGVLYVDEVNLLDDTIVDLLLDAAASGVSTVAREGISLTHPAEFLLVGTMNPEEGALRPQLLDRFGLCADITTLRDPEQRTQIVERRLAFDADPVAFRQDWLDAEKQLTTDILRARERLARIRPERRWITRAAELSLSLEAVGHRADILMIKAAATLAALAGRETLAEEDLAAAASVVYPHRQQRTPFGDDALTGDALESHVHAFLGVDNGKKKL